MHHFQCQQSEFKCKKVPDISDQNKQCKVFHTPSRTQSKLSFIDAYCMIIRKTTIMLLPLYRSVISEVFHEVHIEHNIEFCTVKTNKSSSFQ